MSVKNTYHFNNVMESSVDRSLIQSELRKTVIKCMSDRIKFDSSLRVEALVGVTVDSSDVFLLNVNSTCLKRIINREQKSDVRIPCTKLTNEQDTEVTNEQREAKLTNEHQDSELTVEHRCSEPATEPYPNVELTNEGLDTEDSNENQGMQLNEQQHTDSNNTHQHPETLHEMVQLTCNDQQTAEMRSVTNGKRGQHRKISEPDSDTDSAEEEFDQYDEAPYEFIPDIADISDVLVPLDELKQEIFDSDMEQDQQSAAMGDFLVDNPNNTISSRPRLDSSDKKPDIRKTDIICTSNMDTITNPQPGEMTPSTCVGNNVQRLPFDDEICRELADDGQGTIAVDPDYLPRGGDDSNDSDDDVDDKMELISPTVKVLYAQRRADCRKETKGVKRRPRIVYSKDDVCEAIIAVKAGMNVREAARTFGVPRTTLHDKLQGRTPIDATNGANPVLTAIEETNLVDYIKHMTEMGQPPSRKSIVMEVNRILENDQRRFRFKNGIPGKDWMRAFKRRNRLVLDLPKIRRTYPRCTLGDQISTDVRPSTTQNEETTSNMSLIS